MGAYDCCCWKLPSGSVATLAWGALPARHRQTATYQPPTPPCRRPHPLPHGHVEVGVENRARRSSRGFAFFKKIQTRSLVLVKKPHMRFGDIRQMKASTLEAVPAGCRSLRSI